MHYVILATELERFRMVTDSSAARFQQKYDFMKFTTVFQELNRYTQNS